MEIPDTRYAKTSDGVYLAYQVLGEGDVDVVWQFDIVANADMAWESAVWGSWLEGLASFSRVILHDRRGIGLSSRNVPLPNLETRVADLRTVLDEVGSDRPFVAAGLLEGGAPNVLLAAAEPQSVRSLVWFSPYPRVVWSPDYPWGMGPEDVKEMEESLSAWGTAGWGTWWREGMLADGQLWPVEEAEVLGRMTRHTCTPDVALELLRIWYQTDVRGLLPSVKTPSLLLAMHRGELERTEYVASLMPNARVAMIDLTGEEASQVQAKVGSAVDEFRRFIGVERPPQGLDTVLSTVLFTDIVGSTERQAAIGDRAWKDLVARHHAIVREGLRRWHGQENDTAGDGFYATFDGPARAIRCAVEVAERVRDIGIAIRAGVHTGECELIEGKAAGLTVSIGARVAAAAGASEVVVSQTVKDLVAGSGFVFEDRGQHELKGVRDQWRLYSISSGREVGR